MELDPLQQELLAGLHEHPGFQILIGLMKEQEAAYCDCMARAEGPKQLHGFAEAYRTFRSFREFMEERVGEVASELERQREVGLVSATPDVDRAWLERFGGPRAA